MLTKPLASLVYFLIVYFASNTIIIGCLFNGMFCLHRYCNNEFKMLAMLFSQFFIAWTTCGIEGITKYFISISIC